MFAKTIIDSDAFLDMPLSTQSLYFHLSMRADDDGFINNPKKIQRMIGASDDDLKLLMAKSFIIAFDSGVVVIKHWRIHNYIQKDRYKETVYLEEKEMLGIKENNAYTLEDKTMDTECIHDVYSLEAQDRIGKDSLGKVREGKDKTPALPKHKYGEYQHVLLKENELDKLNNEFGTELTQACITFLDEYIEMKGYKAKSHYLCIKKWVVEAVKEKGRKNGFNKPMNSKAQELEASYEMMARWAQEG